ncbi:MAG: molybdate ABC transporter substrate-binding protein [Geobacter sp.]
MTGRQSDLAVQRLAWCLVLVVFLWTAPAVAAEPSIAAASDLKFALDEIAQAFQQKTGHRPRITYGSSGVIASQIRNGAPYQLYLSADEQYVLSLHHDGFTRDRGSLYGVGRIVLVVPTASRLTLDAGLEGLPAQIAAGRLRRIAIANPEHAPYGRRAEEALRRVGSWEAVRPRLILGENVSQAAQFALSGSADGGIIALSLALSPQLQPLLRYLLIPERLHSPLRQRMVLLTKADQAAEAFYRFMQEPHARAIMRRYGFVLPGEGA